MDKEDLRKFVNKIFTKKGYPPVRKFAAEFADGSKYNLNLYNFISQHLSIITFIYYHRFAIYPNLSFLWPSRFLYHQLEYIISR